MSEPTMTGQTAEVVRVSKDQAWLRPRVLSACSACGVRDHCGSGVLAAWSSRRGQLLQVTNTCDARVGDRVLIAIADFALVQAAVLAYLLPLLAMILVSLAVTAAGASELQAAFAAVLALTAGLLAARHLGRRKASALRPRLLKILRPSATAAHPTHHPLKPESIRP